MPEQFDFRERGSEAGNSDADSTDSGCKFISLESDTPNGSPEENLSPHCPNKEISLPNVLEALKSLTEDEVESRAQQLALALQTDAQTLVRRLQLRQRHRDLAEKNLEREVDRMRLAMQSLQYLCIDSNSLDVLTTVQTQLDCVRTSAISVSSTSEAYGFVQSEERMAAAVAPLVRFVDNVILARLERQVQPPRSPFLNLDEPRDDERVMRRRSVAALPISLESRRRASIPFLPRPPSPLTRNGAANQPPSPGLDLSRRDSSLRQRRDTRIPDVQMTEILESPERPTPPTTPCCNCTSLNSLNSSSSLSGLPLIPQTPSSTVSNIEKTVEYQLHFAPVCRLLINYYFITFIATLIYLWFNLEYEMRETPV